MAAQRITFRGWGVEFSVELVLAQDGKVAITTTDEAAIVADAGAAGDWIEARVRANLAAGVQRIMIRERGEPIVGVRELGRYGAPVEWEAPPRL